MPTRPLPRSPCVWRGRLAGALLLLVCLPAAAAAQQPQPPGAQPSQGLDTLGAAVVAAPVGLPTMRTVRRAGAERLEAPLAAITTGSTTLHLLVSLDVRPGLTCRAEGCEGSVRLELLERTRPLERIALPAPIAVDLYGMDMVTPGRLLVNATRTVTTVLIRTSNHQPTLTIRPGGLPAVDVALPLRTLRLRVSAAERRIDAWGLARTRLEIAPVNGLEPAETIAVQLEGAGVRVEPSVVRVTARQGASAEARSRGLGTAVVSARGPAWVQPGDVRIRVAPPVLYILLALLGGFIGTYARDKVAGPPAGKDAARAVTMVAIGLAAALLAVGTAVVLQLGRSPLPTSMFAELFAFLEAGAIAFGIDYALTTMVGGSGGRPPPARRTGGFPDARTPPGGWRSPAVRR